LIVGGGFHGKSTLLNAIERSIYDHIPGDGREYIVADNKAMKIRAEDGRCVHHLNLANYINHLPMGKDTADFSTQDASGSTSQ
ncbi:isopentenyl-diphosphate delta-isomerase, partial [Vibrio parahaemolyticus]|nr:isopentenyl-diphosphate delta-isomerase [Vibrio parahaemolyticus]